MNKRSAKPNWKKLIKYYNACIALENIGDTILHGSKEENIFWHLPEGMEEWIFSGKEEMEVNQKNDSFYSLKDFVSAKNKNGAHHSFFYGFPCYTQPLEQHSSEHIIQPIFIFRISVTETDAGYELSFLSKRPIVNFSFFSKWINTPQEKQYFNNWILESWDEKKSRKDNFAEIFRVLERFCASKKIVFPKGQTEGMVARLERGGRGVVPSAVVFKNQDSPFTHGLEGELNNLQSTTPNNVWKHILGQNKSNPAKQEKHNQFVEITKINDEQRAAIQSAFNNTITVVKGPAGTGKSQVVLNIIANALFYGQTVLFGSRNHKAIEVVLERLHDDTSHPVAIKYKGGLHRTDFIETVTSTIKGISHYDSQIISESIMDCEDTIHRTNSTIKKAQKDLEKIYNRHKSYDKINSHEKFWGIKIPLSVKKWGFKLFLNIKEEKERDELERVIDKERDDNLDASKRYASLLMKQRLKNLSKKDRDNIASYPAIVKRMESNIKDEKFSQELAKMYNEIFRSIARSFPAIAVTNLSVRRVFPMNKDIVDIVIIDEASQCDIASALPLIYRAKRAVIIGDNQQLSHISSLGDDADEQLQIEMGLKPNTYLNFSYNQNSLFDLASARTSDSSHIELLEHYRSRAEIINLVNDLFYGGRLMVRTDYRDLPNTVFEDVVVWHDVVGEAVRPPTGSAYNDAEVKKVVELVKQLTQNFFTADNGRAISLGVVTPFRLQANKIKGLVKKEVDESLLSKLHFEVGTAHTYQGDERDIMIFSPVISRGMPQSSLAFLGNKNLFNVSMTRARSELHIVGDRSACASAGINSFSKLVNYIEKLESERSKGKEKEFESPWEKTLYDALAKRGIKTMPQYILHQYRIDLAIPDEKIAIEVDGVEYHRDGYDGGHLQQDLKRDEHIRMYGWRVKRFWVYQLSNNLERCVNEVNEMVNANQDEPKSRCLERDE